MEIIKFKAKAFKRMENPYGEKNGSTKYVCYVNVSDIPKELENWMSTNPREQKLTTDVAKAIRESLENSKENFHELNRGIVFSVSDIKYDNKDNYVYMYLENETDGNIDGGHTLKLILDSQRKGTITRDKYVFLEIFTNIDCPIELAEARNTSVQVTQASIEELKNTFDCIKEVIKDKEFANRIYYKQNELSGQKNTIDVREIVAIINMFNQHLYPISDFTNISYPIQSYTGKESSLNAFIRIEKEKREEIIHNMSKIIPDIFNLWEKIETDFANQAKKGKKIYKAKKYAKYNGGNIVCQTMFGNADLDYVLPKGLLYPLVGAFRALVRIDASGAYYWKEDPIIVWEKLGPNLAKMLLTQSEDLSDVPETIAKSQNTWGLLYKELYIYSLSK